MNQIVSEIARAVGPIEMGIGFIFQRATKIVAAFHSFENQKKKQVKFDLQHPEDSAQL